MLPQSPLVALYDRSTVLTGACGDFPDPVGRTLAHQFPMGWINASALLVAGQGRGSSHKTCFQAAEQQGLPTKVLVPGWCGSHGDGIASPRSVRCSSPSISRGCVALAGEGLPASLPPVALVNQLGAAADPPPVLLLTPAKSRSPLECVLVVE